MSGDEPARDVEQGQCGRRGIDVANFTAFDRGRDEALEEARLPIDHRAAQGLTLSRRADLAADLVDVHPEEVLMLLEVRHACGNERCNRRLQRGGRLDAVADDRFQILHAGSKRRLVDVALRPVVEVDRSLCDIRLSRDGVHRGVFESVRAEDVPGRGHQFGPAEFVEDVFFLRRLRVILAGDS